MIHLTKTKDITNSRSNGKERSFKSHCKKVIVTALYRCRTSLQAHTETVNCT